MSFRSFVCLAVLGAGIAGLAWADDDNNQGNGNGKGNGQGNSQATTITRDFYFPPVTLTSTETARIIVVNTAPPPAGTGTAPSCAGTLSFLTSGTTQPSLTKDYAIGSDKFAVLDLQFGASGITGPPGEVVGKVQIKTPTPANSPCNLGMSLVVFDTVSGAAHIALTGSSSLNGIPPGLIGR